MLKQSRDQILPPLVQTSCTLARLVPSNYSSLPEQLLNFKIFVFTICMYVQILEYFLYYLVHCFRFKLEYKIL